MSLEIVSRVRSHYSTPLGDSHSAFLVEVITALGPAYGLLRKSGGNRINVAGVDVSKDVVTDRVGTQYDILIAEEAGAGAAWSPVDPTHYVPDPSRFYRPDGLVDPPVVEDPDEDSDETLSERVDQLEEALAEFVLATINSLKQADSKWSEIADTVENLKEFSLQLSDRLDEVQGPVAELVEWRANGSTETRGWGPTRHSHKLTETK